MKRLIRLLTIASIVLIAIGLSACAETAENEHLPEYCRTYSGFMSFASEDLYELLGGINRVEYLSIITTNELTFEVYDETREIDLDGIQCFQNLTSLSLTGTSFKDISEISALKNIQRIELIDTNVVDISSFRNLSKVNSLTISNTKTLQSVDGVEEMTKLTYLDLSDNGIVNIDGLNNLINLNTLILSNNEITFFPSIPSLYFLETLDVSNNNIIELGDDLSGLVNLKNFDASENQICDLSTLDDLLNLETLDLSFNDLGCNGTSPDFSSLEGATKLTELYLNDNNLTSISDLSGRSLPLEELHLENNELTDITPLGQYTTIEELYLFNNQIVDIENLTGMTNITQIDLSDNLIEDFSGLRSIPDLERIDLSDNNVTFIPDISSSWPSLRVLDLENNQLEDTLGVAGHPNLRTLIINNNGLEELGGISNLPLLDELILYRVEDPDSEEEFIPEDNPNIIRVLNNSYNNVPNIVITDNGDLDLGYEFGPNVEIYGSFNDMEDIQTVDFSGMDINIIDEFSFTLENLQGIYLANNNIADISFLRGNPNLRQIDISNNPIGNLTILNGTDNDDFDNLEQILARDITGNNALDGAFIGLTDLSFLDLTDTTIVSISNSFNNLDELTTLVVSGESLTFIDNSFNNIFQVYASENDIALLDGNLYSITDSFNNGLYDSIIITGHTNNSGNPSTITNSFNNVEASNISSIVISNNEFETVDNSFNSVIADNVFLANNGTLTMTNVFDLLDLGVELNLQNNELSTIDLSTVTSVPSLDISNNALTTVAFIDAIPDLETLDISAQFTVDDTAVTLTVIDGINNMVTLTDIIMDQLAITDIDGFKGIGITDFNYNVDDNNGVQIQTISATSFDSSIVTTVDLSGHELTNIDFLTNFSLVTDLSISVDMADLSQLQGISFESTLETLFIESVQEIPSFSILSNYDTVDTLTISSPLNTTIHELDGLDSVTELNFVEADSIDTFTSSFNTMPNLGYSEIFFTTFSSISTITNSFDMFGKNGLHEDVILEWDMIITDSFNNVVTVTMENNGELTPNFDGLSFDSMQFLVFTNAEYSSYSFLNDYPFLTSITIESLEANIPDMNYAQIANLTIDDTVVGVNNIDVTMNEFGVINLTSDTFGAFSVTSNALQTTFDMVNSDVTVNSSATSYTVSGETDNLIINSASITSLDLTSYAGLNGTFNTTLLQSVQSNAISGSNFNSLEINSDQAALSVDVLTPTLNLNNTNLNVLTLDAEDSFVTINSTEANVSVGGAANIVSIVENTLVTVDVTGSFSTLNLQSTALTTATLNDTTSLNLNVDSDQASLTVSGTGISTATIDSNNFTSGTVSLPGANVTMNNSTIGAINMVASATSFTVNGSNITSVTLDDTSNIEALVFDDGSSIQTLTLGLASIETIDLTSLQSSLVVSGSGTYNMTYTMLSLNDITLNTPNANAVIETNQATVSGNLQVNNITFENGSSLSTLNVQNGSTINDLLINNTPTISNLNFGTATVNQVTANSNQSALSLTGSAVSNATLSGDNLISLDADVLGSLTINSSNTSAFSVEITADTANIDTNTSILSINSNTVATTLNLTTDNVSTLLFGNADITSATVTGSAASLSVTGSQVDSLDVTSVVETLDVTMPLATTLVVSSSSTNPVSITTSTSNIDISATQDVTLTSSDLVTADIAIGSNDITFNTDKVALDFTVGGTMGNALFSTSTLNTLSFDVGTSMSSLELDGTNVTVLDLTNNTVDTLVVTSDITSLQITSPTLTTADINTPNLTSLNTTAANADYDINTTVASFDLDGSAATVTMTALNMNSIDLATFDANALQFVSNNLSTLDTLAITLDTLVLTTPLVSLNVTTEAADVTLTGSTSGSITLTSTSGLSTISTNMDEIDLTAAGLDVTLTASNLNALTGTVGNLVVTEAASGALSINMSATSIDVTDNQLTSVFLTGVNTVGSLDVTSSSVLTVATNDVTMSTLNLDISSASLNIDSLATQINMTNSYTGAMIMNVRTNGQTINTYASDVTLNTTNASSTDLNYVGTTAFVLDINNLTNVSLVADNTTSLDVDGLLTDFTASGALLETLVATGAMENFSVTGAAINSVTTTGLTVNTTYTMTNTLVTGLDFVSNDLLASVVTLDINSLNVSDIESIVTKLEGSGVSLVSPIIEQDVIDYYYQEQYTLLTDQEAIDNTRYNAIFATKVSDALAVFRSNVRFDYIDNTTLQGQIEAQTYLTADDYLDGYAVDQGYANTAAMVADLGQGVVDGHRTEIQATLDNATVTFTTEEINTEVDLEIQGEATTYATNANASRGFTIG